MSAATAYRPVGFWLNGRVGQVRQHDMSSIEGVAEGRLLSGAVVGLVNLLLIIRVISLLVVG